MKKTKIEWTDDSDNPIMTADGSFFCTPVSEGCKFCYAEVMARRLSGMRHAPAHDWKVGKAPELVLRREILDSWARQGRPRKHFVSSMTDICGEFVPDDWFFEILDAMAAAPHQTFQILTKRADRLYLLCWDWLHRRAAGERFYMMPPNIWLGVSAENQRRADERIPALLRIPAAVHWVSAEPLIGPLNLTPYLRDGGRFIPRLSWVVTGGESGHGARPPHPLWFHVLDDQCRASGVAFFFKQWGDWSPFPPADGNTPRMSYVDWEIGEIKPPNVATTDATAMYKVGKKYAGRELSGRTHNEFPFHVKTI
jgi:protein gp37